MSRKKKNEFWDDLEDDILDDESDSHSSENADEYIEDEGFVLTKSKPIKVIARILLFLSVAVIILSGYTCYQYITDRYVDGTYTTSYFESNSFSSEYNDAVEKLIGLLKVIEDEGDVTEERAQELAEGIMGESTNFSYYVTNESGEVVIQSSDDAKDRIESSNHFLRVSDIDNDFTVDSGVPSAKLDESSWQSALAECSNAYQIYTSVDNNLTQEDSFYESYLEYQELSENFNIAKIALIVAIIVFIVLLVYCVMATGTRKGYYGIKLSWFDRIYTELGILIIVAIVAILIYGMTYITISEPDNQMMLMAVDGFLIYVAIVRGYFSLVRRIKAGTFISNSIIYKICHLINKQLNKLPKAVKILLIVLFLLILNGALVYGLLYGRDLAVGGFPIIFVVAPIVIIIELIGFINCIFTGGEEEEDYEEEEEEPQVAAEEDIPQQDADQSGWNETDFAAADAGSEDQGGYMDAGMADAVNPAPAKKAAKHSTISDNTEVLSGDKRNAVLNQLGYGETQMLDTQAIRDAEKASLQEEALYEEPGFSGGQDAAGKPGERTVSMEPVGDETLETAGVKQVSTEMEKTVPNVNVQPEQSGAEMGSMQENIQGMEAESALTSDVNEADSGKTKTQESAAGMAGSTATDTTATVVNAAATADSASAAATAGAAATTAAKEAGVAAGAAAETMTAGEASDLSAATESDLVDFIQLNKDVRKLYRVKLKARSIGVTLRAPQTPILLDIDKSNAIKVLSILFDNVEKYAQEGSRVYIEMYAQNGKMIYLMKNTIRTDLADETSAAMGEGLKEAKRIVQSEKGKFINSVEGDTYKVGILLDTAKTAQA